MGEHDKAAHVTNGKTKRNRVLYGPAGHSYVFQLRGHHCLNAVAESEGSPGCVLIRVLEPINNFNDLRINRKKDWGFPKKDFLI